MLGIYKILLIIFSSGIIGGFGYGVCSLLSNKKIDNVNSISNKEDIEIEEVEELTESSEQQRSKLNHRNGVQWCNPSDSGTPKAQMGCLTLPTNSEYR